jgi:hypothetical protein
MPSFLTYEWVADVGWNDVLATAGSLASLVGLVISYLAWQRAKGAEEAANRARDAVRSGNAVEELQRLATKSKEMLIHVQAQQYTEARSKGADVLVEVSQAITRWNIYLSAEEKENLEKARGKVRTVSRALSEIHHDIGAEVHGKLVDSCHDIATRLAESTGSIISRMAEKGAFDGRTD